MGFHFISVLSDLPKDKKISFREKGKIRMRKSRALAKAEGREPRKPTSTTRKEREAKQRIWREAKAKQIRLESPETKEKRNARRRELWALKKVSWLM